MIGHWPPGFRVEQFGLTGQGFVLWGPCICGCGEDCIGHFPTEEEAQEVAWDYWNDPDIHDQLLKSLKEIRQTVGGEA